MHSPLIASALLLAITLIVHSMGLSGVLRWSLRQHLQTKAGFWKPTWLLIRIVWMLIVIHLLEIAVWALFYWRQRCLPDAESAFYFSGVTYTTVGYGDLVLPKDWRFLGPVEALAGILMCGLSTGFFFAVVSRIHAPKSIS